MRVTLRDNESYDQKDCGKYTFKSQIQCLKSLAEGLNVDYREYSINDIDDMAEALDLSKVNYLFGEEVI